MSDGYHPPKADIDRVLSQTNSDPKKLAIAYLRAQRRFRKAKAEAAIFEATADMSLAVMKRDTSSAEEAVSKLERSLRTDHQSKET
ncbi:MAG: hypothetical protein CMM07_25710 [Rhodopirellula sp.]|nr:hypothetical protein [Rhodopirellula sp.]